MKKLLFNLLYFSKGESRGAALLIVLCFGVLLLPDWIKKQWTRAETETEPEWKEQLEEHFAQKTAIVEAADTLRPAVFDPNTVSMDSLLAMGVPEKVAHTLIKYRDKGGRFRRKEDLKKIYGMDSVMYDQLSGFIQLQQPKSPRLLASRPSQASQATLLVDINRADQEEWQQLRGIGPVLSGRIIKFREALGGFVSIEQVGETYGVVDSIFQNIRPYLQQSPPFRKIDINYCSLEELAGHPYVSWKLARRILLYRGQHGFFEDWEDFEKMKEVPKEVKNNIKPYLKF